jgi:hypothetical protein
MRLSSFLAALALSPSRWPIGLTRLIESLNPAVERRSEAVGAFRRSPFFDAPLLREGPNGRKTQADRTKSDAICMPLSVAPY